MTLIRYIDLPFAIKGFTIQDENLDYNVYINSRYNKEQQEQTINHELNHISRGDFDSPLPAHILERLQ